jgi:hypothetical protein
MRAAHLSAVGCNQIRPDSSAKHEIVYASHSTLAGVNPFGGPRTEQSILVMRAAHLSAWQSHQTGLPQNKRVGVLHAVAQPAARGTPTRERRVADSDAPGKLMAARRVGQRVTFTCLLGL